MEIKKRPNHSHYLDILRKMSPEQKVQKVFELNAFGKNLRLQGLRMTHPELNEKELEKLYLKKIESCHNRNY